MKDKDKLEELISIYALGALEGEELKEVEEILSSGSEEAQEILRKYQEVTLSLSYGSKGIMPDSSLKRKVLKEILGSRDMPVSEPSLPFWKRFGQLGFSLAGAVAVGLVLFFLVSNNSLNRQLGEKNIVISELNQKISKQQTALSSLKSVIAEKEAEIGDLKQSYARLDELSEFLEDPNVVVIHLSNTHDNEEAGSGVLVDMDDNEALFYCLDLPNAPEGKTYQWWVKADGTHKSIAVFNVDSKGSSVIKHGSLSDLGNIEQYSVTIEQAGGAEKPTGERLFAGDHRGSSL